MSLKTPPQKRNFLSAKLYEKVIHSIVATNALGSFCIVTHRCTASFSQKIVLHETNNIFYSLENLVWHKVNVIFWKCKWNKGKVTIEGNTPLSHPPLWKNFSPYIGLSPSKNKCWSTPHPLLGQFPPEIWETKPPTPEKNFFPETCWFISV